MRVFVASDKKRHNRYSERVGAKDSAVANHSVHWTWLEKVKYICPSEWGEGGCTDF